MAWFSLAKIALQAGSKDICQPSERQKWLCQTHSLMHAERMARGEEAYQGKLLRSETIGLERRIRIDNCYRSRL